ncbi:MAG: GntR family transcriptional regulator [Herbinix sp.]|jgi:DNA-binding LacI/PurR family transcriptional regulator|nr:GntR family transcriptional regulator [Herbinix sp.]
MSKSLKYSVVKQSIMDKIQSGELKPNDKLPSEEEYSETFNVSGITIRKALSELANEGYIKRTKRKGTFVNGPVSEESASKLFALVLSAEDYFDVSYMKIIKGAQSMAAEYNYSLIVEWTSNNLTQEAETIKKMLDRNIDGFIIYPYDPIKSKSNYMLIEQKNIPYVLLDRYNVNHPCYFAGCCNYDGAVLATNELLQLKHTKIKFAGYHFFLNSEQERYDGYCSAMRQAGLEVTKDNFLVNIDYDLLKKQILDRDITALFCCNDRLAIKIIQNLTERSVRIPQDVSIIGFDDWDSAHNTSIGLTTVRQNFNEIGANATHLLMSAIQGKVQGNNTKLLSGVSLIIRDSIGTNPYA